MTTNTNHVEGLYRLLTECSNPLWWSMVAAGRMEDTNLDLRPAAQRVRALSALASYETKNGECHGSSYSVASVEDWRGMRLVDQLEDAAVWNDQPWDTFLGFEPKARQFDRAVERLSQWRQRDPSDVTVPWQASERARYPWGAADYS